MYMTKPKQVQKKLSENTGKTFFVIMPPFTSRGGGIITKITVLKQSTWNQILFYLIKMKNTTHQKQKIYKQSPRPEER